MQVINSAEEFRALHEASVATIGKYDGLHLGHQGILRELKTEAARLGLPSVVVLSEPQPEEFFLGVEAPARLTPFEDKVRLLERFGIDIVYKLGFDETVSQMSAESFIRNILIDGLNVKSIVVGHDFAFGHQRSGNVELLAGTGEKAGFNVREIPPFSLDQERISSTLVRDLLAAGDCQKVHRVLGRAYSISGTVVEGKKLGRQLGFPTANIALADGKLALRGVFAVRIDAGDKIYRGVANIGYRPTVDDTPVAHLEVYLFHFHGNLYGETINVSFLKKIRDEQKFPDINALKAGIDQDVATAKAWFWKREAEVV